MVTNDGVARGLTPTFTKCNSYFGYETTTNLGFSPFTVSELVFPNDTKSPATMTLSSFPEADHCFNFLTLNSPVEFSATYKLAPPLVITK